MDNKKLEIGVETKFNDDGQVGAVLPKIAFFNKSDMEKRNELLNKILKGKLSKDDRNEAIFYMSNVVAENQNAILTNILNRIESIDDINERIKTIRSIFVDNQGLTVKILEECRTVSNSVVRKMLVNQMMNAIEHEEYLNKKLAILIANLSDRDIKKLRNFFSFCFNLTSYYRGSNDERDDLIIRTGIASNWCTVKNLGDDILNKLGVNAFNYEDYRYFCDMGIIRSSSQVTKVNNLGLDKEVLCKDDNNKEFSCNVNGIDILINNSGFQHAYELDYPCKSVEISYTKLTEIGEMLYNIFNDEGLVNLNYLEKINIETLKIELIKLIK